MTETVLTPNDALSKAVAFLNAGEVDKARQIFEAASKAYPDVPEFHYNVGQLLLLEGDYARGWDEFEWRLRFEGVLPSALPGLPWRGEDIRSKRLFLFGEQGIGDNIQFARCASMVGATGARIILACPKALAELFKTLPNVEQIVPDGGTIPGFDYHFPLLSMPRMMQVRPGNIPAPVPYLFAEPDRAQWWRTWMARYPGPRIGLVWRGNPGHKRDAVRSIPLADFAAVTAAKNATFFALHLADVAREIDTTPGADGIVDLSALIAPEKGGLVETAAAISALDLVISVDTSVCHLAGALNKPVWTLISHVPDWRWGMDGDTTRWYPSMTLFRQSEGETWQPVLERVSQRLEATTNGHF